MAATNYTPIQLYFSTTASAVPLAANLAQGELAINITDGKLYYEDGSGVVQVIASKGAGTIGGSTTQIQYNNAGALAGNAAMTFNSGTNTTTLTTLNLTNALGAVYGGTAQSAYTQGDVLYASATNTLAKLGIGTVNYILTSSGSVPQWSAPSSISVLTATNLAGGLAGSVPYQSALDTTTFLAIGAANRVMTSTGSAPQWVTSLTSLTGVSSSSITNTSLTSGRVVFSGASGLESDSASLTFNGTTLSAGGFSTTGLSTLVQTVKIGDSNFSGVAVFAPATPAKLYIGTGTVTDATSAIGATNATGAVSSLAITPIAATNTSVTYTNASTLYIAGAPSAGTNVTITNPYSLYVAAGDAYFGGTVTAGTVNLTTLDLTNLEVTNIKAKDGTASATIADSTGIFTHSTATVFTAGTAALPAITTTGDTNTGIWFPAADTIAFTEGGVESMRIDASGNLGIGSTSPIAKLDISGISTSQNGLRLTATSGGQALAAFTADTSTGEIRIGGTVAAAGNYFPVFYAAGTERARIDSSGNLLLGTTGANTKLTVLGPDNSTAISIINRNTADGGVGLGFDFVGAQGGTDCGDLVFYTTPNTGGAALTGRARIDSNGNLGLGTTAPATLFHMLKDGVGGSAPNQPELRIQHNDINAIGTNGSNGGILGFVNLQQNNTGWLADSIWGRLNFSCSQPTSGAAQLGASILAAADGAIGGQQSKSYLAFYTSDGSNNGNNQEKLRITSGTSLEFSVSQHLASVYSLSANLFLGQGTNLLGRNNLNFTSLSTNAYEDGTTSAPKFINAASAAVKYYQYLGAHVWQTSTATPVADALVNMADVMTLDASGNLLVGTTATLVTGSSGFRYLGGGRIAVTDAASTDAAATTYEAYSTGAGAFRFYVGYGGTIFATSITITAISDERLKENVRNLETGLNSIMALKPRRFDWKEGKGQDKKNVAGFIAQEFEEVFPECVSTSKAGEDGIEYKNINHETLIPTLVKAMQEQQALITQLTARITALEGA